VSVRGVLALAALLAAAPGCERGAPAESAPPVQGRWQRIDQPSEWFEFDDDGTWRSRSFTGTEIEGRYRQSGTTVTLTVVPVGHGATLTVGDSLMVMEEGTRYRRVSR
jgi:hypothetical protein